MSFKAFYPAVLWMGVIFVLSTIPGASLPDFSFWHLLTFDKLVHALFFTVLSFQLMRGCIKQYRKPRIRSNSGKIAVVGAFAYGGFVELYQELYLIDRYGDWVDVLANLIGALAGVLVFRIIYFEYIR